MVRVRGFRTASGLAGSGHHLYLSAWSHLHGSPSITVSLLLVAPGEFQASAHWPRPHPMLISRTIWGGGLALSSNTD